MTTGLRGNRAQTSKAALSKDRSTPDPVWGVIAMSDEIHDVFNFLTTVMPTVAILMVVVSRMPAMGVTAMILMTGGMGGCILAMRLEDMLVRVFGPVGVVVVLCPKALFYRGNQADLACCTSISDLRSRSADLHLR